MEHILGCQKSSPWTSAVAAAALPGYPSCPARMTSMLVASPGCSVQPVLLENALLQVLLQRCVINPKALHQHGC